MPQRLLRPGLATSKRWNKCGWLAQSLYIRLITLVDDYGRFEADPELLRSLAFPFGDPKGRMLNPADICEHLSELGSNKLAVFYQVDGKQYLQLLNWRERTRTDSKFPEPPKEVLLTNDSKCQQMIASPPSPSPSPSPAVVIHSRPTLSDEEWLAELQRNQAYAGINVKGEFGKMQAWCSANHKQPTRRRFVNWLNRAEKPMTTKKYVGPNL